MLSNRKIFVFGELMAMPSLQAVGECVVRVSVPPCPARAEEGRRGKGRCYSLTPSTSPFALFHTTTNQLRGTEHEPWLRVLEIYAYGTYRTYQG